MGHLLPECLHQASQLQEVFQAERRAPGRDGHDGILRNPVGPTGRNGRQLALLVMVIEDFRAPVEPPGHDGKLLTAAGVKGMDDTKDSILIARTGCS